MKFLSKQQIRKELVSMSTWTDIRTNSINYIPNLMLEELTSYVFNHKDNVETKISNQTLIAKILDLRNAELTHPAN